jgi:pyruvate dehydrogenase E2 component (dihydrolipoamide acetyltransferase)
MSERYSVIPLTPIRKIIAARMTEAKQTIPHFRIVADIHVDALIDCLRQLRERRPGESLSLNDLLTKACAEALTDAPQVNIQWAGDSIRQYQASDISIVVAVEGGLSTPILRDANLKSIWDIAREIRQLTQRAKSNTLKMQDIVGGSFSVSNLGMYGVDQFDAIISPPQCAILAIGRAQAKCVVSSERVTKVAQVLRATLSVDHRAIDGATAAAFMSAWRKRMEHPDYLLEEQK